MVLPGILKINEQYFIKVDESAIHLPQEITLLEEAVAYLIIYYHVLNINFPETLKFVFLFFEKLLEIPPSSPSEDVKRVYSSLFGGKK